MRVLVKIYGDVQLANASFAADLRTFFMQNSCEAFAASLSLDDMLCLDNGNLAIRFEGISFPIQDLLDLLQPAVLRGKIDYIDMENWRLIRCLWDNGIMQCREGDLNAALEYNGI